MAIDIDALTPADWEQVCRIYQEGIATGQATFETEVPSWEEWDAAHHRFASLIARLTAECSAGPRSVRFHAVVATRESQK